MFSILPPFSLFLMFFVIIHIIRMKKDATSLFHFFLTLHVLVTLFVQNGYFIKLPIYEFSYSEATLILVILSAFLLKAQRATFSFSNYLLFASVIIGWIMISLIPPSYESVPVGVYWSIDNMKLPVFSLQFLKYLLRLVLCFFVINSSIGVINFEHLEKIKRLIVRISIIVMLLLLFEYCTKTFFMSPVFETTKKFIFGYSYSGGWENPDIFIRGNTVALTGLYFEPSALSWAFLIIGAAAIRTKFKYRPFYLFSLIALQLMTTSFSSVLVVVVLLIMIFIQLPPSQKITALILVLVGILGLSLFSISTNGLLDYYFERLQKALQTLFSSEFTNEFDQEIRIYSVHESWQSFIHRPLFGVGLGANYSYSFLITGLANLGLVGMSAWFSSVKYYFKNCGILTRNKDTIVFIIVLISYCLIGTIANLYDINTILLFVIVLNKLPVPDKGEKNGRYYTAKL